MRIQTKRLIIFLAVTFTLTWVLFYILYRIGGLNNPYYAMLLPVCMLCPAIGSILTRLITGEGFSHLMLKPNFKGHIRFYLMAVFGVPGLILLGTGLYFLCFPNHFDASLTGVALMFRSGGNIPASISPEQLRLYIIVSQLLSGVLLAPLINLIPSLGEELGWRGYLLPLLCARFSLGVSVLLSGAIWGVWHAPIIAMGYNYGVDYTPFPWAGIGMMILMCVVIGIFFSYVALRSGSAIPAAAAHGAFNGFAAFGALFLKGAGNPFLGPAPTGIIGLVGFAAVGAVLLIRIFKEPRTFAAEYITEDKIKDPV